MTWINGGSSASNRLWVYLWNMFRVLFCFALLYLYQSDTVDLCHRFTNNFHGSFAYTWQRDRETILKATTKIDWPIHSNVCFEIEMTKLNFTSTLIITFINSICYRAMMLLSNRWYRLPELIITSMADISFNKLHEPGAHINKWLPFKLSISWKHHFALI